MKYFSNKFRIAAFAILVNCYSLASWAQQTSSGPNSQAATKVTLKIGDQAPPVQYAKWIKGTPVSSFANDKLYVVEFWATWCGPCKEMMPHLSEMAKKYQNKVTFASFDIWESRKPTETYDDVLKRASSFVAEMGNKMAYNVGADTKDGDMAKNWMTASGQSGIPASFIIKNNKIIWIGHPIKLDSTLEVVLSGKYNMQAYADNFNKKTSARVDENEKEKAELKPYTDAMADKDYPKALTELDKAIPKLPTMTNVLLYTKFSLLLDHFSEPQVVGFFKEWHSKDTLSAIAYGASMILQKEGLSKETYLLALDYTKTLLNNPSVMKPMVYASIAMGYDKIGDTANAVDYQQKAIAVAQEWMKANKNPAYINSTTLKSFQDLLDKYKKKQ